MISLSNSFYLICTTSSFLLFLNVPEFRFYVQIKKNNKESNYVRTIDQTMWSMDLLFVTEYFCIVLDDLFGTASVGCRTNGVKECWRRAYKVLDWGALWVVKLKQMIGVPYSRRSNKIQFQRKKPINAGFWIYWTKFII